jgi:TIR domain
MKVLISHAVEDLEAASAVKELIRRVSLNRIEVWFSSDTSARGGMPIGVQWFSELHTTLKDTDWIVALVTPQSISSPWLYYECGVVASSRSHSVIPLALGLPISSVPMPLAAYQVYDCLNAASLATFIQKLLEADGFLFDEEMTRAVRETTQRRLIDLSGRSSANIEEAASHRSKDDDIASLKSFIEQRFVELYKLLPEGSRPTLNLELDFDASDLVKTNSRFTLNIPAGASFGEVLDEIYFRISDHVKPFTYLIRWTITDTKSKDELSIDAIKRLIPANLLLKSDRTYKITRLTDGDDYLKLALNASQ